MTRTEVKNALLECIKEKYSDIKLLNVQSLNGYYLFEFGEDSVIHFNVKGCKKWKFAIWITEKKKNSDKMQVEMFGQYIDYIDKFKPSASPFCYTATIESISEIDEVASDIDIKLYDFIKKIRMIKLNPLLSRWAIYSEDDFVAQSFLRWRISDFIEYNIVKQFDDFVENKLIKWWLNVVAFIYTKRFKTRKNKFHVKVIDQKGWLPRWILHVVYEDVDSDDIYDIYHKIEPNDYDTRHKWLIPGWVFNNSRITHAHSDEDMRGFYYSNDKEN